MNDSYSLVGGGGLQETDCGFREFVFFHANNTLGLVGGRPTRGRRCGMSRLKINEDAMTLAVAYALRADDSVTDTDKSSIVRHLNCAVFAFCRH